MFAIDPLRTMRRRRMFGSWILMLRWIESLTHKRLSQGASMIILRRILALVIVAAGAVVSFDAAAWVARGQGFAQGAIVAVLVMAPWLAIAWILTRSRKDDSPDDVQPRPSRRERSRPEDVMSRLKAAATNPKLSEATREEARRRLLALQASEGNGG